MNQFHGPLSLTNQRSHSRVLRKRKNNGEVGPLARAKKIAVNRPGRILLSCVHLACATAAALYPAAQVFVGPFAGNEHPPVTHQVCPPPSLPFLLGKIEHPNPN